MSWSSCSTGPASATTRLCSDSPIAAFDSKRELVRRSIRPATVGRSRRIQTTAAATSRRSKKRRTATPAAREKEESSFAFFACGGSGAPRVLAPCPLRERPLDAGRELGDSLQTARTLAAPDPPDDRLGRKDGLFEGRLALSETEHPFLAQHRPARVAQRFEPRLFRADLKRQDVQGRGIGHERARSLRLRGLTRVRGGRVGDDLEKSRGAHRWRKQRDPCRIARRLQVQRRQSVEDRGGRGREKRLRK